MLSSNRQDRSDFQRGGLSVNEMHPYAKTHCFKSFYPDPSVSTLLHVRVLLSLSAPRTRVIVGRQLSGRFLSREYHSMIHDVCRLSARRATCPA